jgi:polyisoprenoid-binding protein YceI
MSTSEIAITPTRLVAGEEVPVVGRWELDPGHTSVEIIGRHFMMTKVRVRLAGVAGTVVIAEDPEQSSVDVTLDMASVTSSNAGRDDHLRSADFFDVENFPTATFRSTSVAWQGTTAAVTGDLTIVGVTRPVVRDVELHGATNDPWGGTRAEFSAWTEINREDWGLTWNQVLETGGALVSKKVRIEIETETVLDA